MNELVKVVNNSTDELYQAVGLLQCLTDAQLGSAQNNPDVGNHFWLTAVIRDKIQKVLDELKEPGKLIAQTNEPEPKEILETERKKLKDSLYEQKLLDETMGLRKAHIALLEKKFGLQKIIAKHGTRKRK